MYRNPRVSALMSLICAILLALVTLLGSVPSSVTAASSQSATVSGVLNVIWGDPCPDCTAEPSEKYLLTDEEGNHWWLEVSPEIAEAAGGLLPFNGKQVQVVGEHITNGDVKTIRVQSIELAPGPTGAATSPAMPIAGSVAWATLPCRFANNTNEQRDKAYFEGLMGSIKPGLDHYWREVSYNTADLTGSDEYDWREMAHERSYYFDADGNAKLALLAQQCVNAHDADVDFNKYQGINCMFNDNLDCCAWGGGATVSTGEGTKSFRTTWMPPWAFVNQGVLAHETGHGFGLPHSSGPYAATYDSQWDVMSAANAVCRTPDPTYGCVAVHTISYHKDKLGAIPGTRKYVADSSANQVITLEHLALPGATGYLMAQIPVGVPGLDFYTVKAREFMGYDNEIPGEAVVIHTVDATWDRPARVVDPDGNGNPNDAGAMWLPGELLVENGISVGVLSQTPSSFMIVINPITDPAIQKASSPNPIIAGSQLYYTISVVNSGPGPAIGVTVTDTLTPEVTYVTDTDTCVEGPAGTLTCSLGNMLSGETRVFTILVEVDSDLVASAGGPTSITNTVSVTADQPDSDLTSNEASAATIVEDEADLKVVKDCKPDSTVLAGEEATCTILVDNLGTSTARNAVLTDTYLSDGTFTFGTITTDTGSCIATPNPQVGSGEVTCNLGDLASGARATVTVPVSADEAQDINDHASASSDILDPDPSNNQAEDSVSVVAVVDLEITKVDLPDPVVAGTTLTYTVNVTNAGPSTATNVVVKDWLPAEMTIDSVSATVGSCEAGEPGDAAQPTICNLGTMSAMASETITVNVTVLPQTPEGALLHNDAEVLSADLDLDNSDNVVSADTTVTPQADLAILKMDFPDPVVAGEQMTYEVSITNNGPSTARGVSLTEQLPYEVSILSQQY